MKFTDGNWLMRRGVHAAYPAEISDVVAEPRACTVYAATRPIRHRGDTLAGPLLTIHCSSPLPNVIRVRLTHFAGQATSSPDFVLCEDPSTDVAVTADQEAISLSSGGLTMRIDRAAPWRVSFLGDGKPLTSSGPRGMGTVALDSGEHYMHEQLSLGVGEQVYGLGERFTAFVKNGQVVETWNEDGGTSSEQAYKNVPFYLTNRGYGVLVNHPERVSFEVASERVARVQFSVSGHALEYFLIYGPTPKQVLERYTALTGRPALPPAWSFGLWLTTSFTTSYDEATVTSFIQGMADRQLPLHVFHFDCFWMREFHWCDFAWDPRTFPDPPAMLQRLKQRGLRICLWINPYIAQRSPLFEEGRRGGFLLRRPNGDVWQWDLWQPGMAVVDFTNPAARTWFTDKLRALLDMGVDCFKTDFGERIPTDVVYHDGSDPQRMHNYYAYLYNQTVFELLEQERGPNEAVLFARSATAGGQRFPVHWGGDSDSSYESMAESLRGGLSLGLSGFGFWSHDIGGFEGTPPTELYKRWIAFGLLSSHSRLHGSHSYRVPWLFDEEAVDVLRLFTRLKCQLMPYVFAQSLATCRTGVPLMRPMLLDFPADPTCAFLDRQYMFGDDLLVAPVFADDGEVSYYLPAGAWTNLLSGKVYQGPGWVQERHSALSMPILARPNAVIALGQEAERPDYDYAEGVTLQAYQLADGHSATVAIPDTHGTIVCSFLVRREGRTVTVERQGRAANWRLLLVGLPSVAVVSAGTAESTPQGLLVVPPAQTAELEIVLEE